MVDVVVCGTIGLDTIKTPFSEEKDAIGGSAVFASYAASFYASAGMVAIKGEDLPEKRLSFLKHQDVSTEGVATKGKNFRWSGSYEFDMNEARTLKTELNSLAEFDPVLPASYKDAPFLFVANTDPRIQAKVIAQMRKPELVLIDTMDYWIQSAKKELLASVRKADILVVNDAEARKLFKTPNLIKAGRAALKLGLRAAIIKKGEHGALLFQKDDFFACPGYPLESLVDPTGCGDTFAGAFLGHYAKHKDMRKAIVHGSIAASFTAEGFGTRALQDTEPEDIDRRVAELRRFNAF